MANACVVCRAAGPLVSEALGLCPDCARTEAALPHARSAHEAARAAFGLPGSPPREARGTACPLCGAACRIGAGERGFCGLRTASEEKLIHLGGTAERGLLSWYRDPLPTNCVADWVCGGSAERGRHNLAVFYESCTLDCLFCQNWHFRDADLERDRVTSAAELADAARADTFCVCFFGGDPASQMPHALAAAERLAARGVTVCWETAGTSDPKLLDRALDLSLRTGGCVKFDLKAFGEPLALSLTGVSNRRTLSNFARAAERFEERPEPPPLLASSLLVPGYVDAREVGRIASFIAGLDPRIPYALLAFAPQFLMADLPRTSRRHAEDAVKAAEDAGLDRVRIGNRHLLGPDYG